MDPETLLTGRIAPTGAWRPLRAGPVSLFLDGVDLRRIRVDGRELANLVYVAVRDAAWNALPPMVEDLMVRQGDDSFEVRFTARHRYGPLSFDWAGHIAGRPDGALRYEMDGRAGSAFQYHRIGLNVLHQTDQVVGRQYRSGGAAGQGGRTFSGSFGRSIAAQAIVGDHLAGMSPALRWLEIDLAAKHGVRLEFDGDDFEMEDQRNYGDSTFKTYSTPLARSGPFQATAGDGIRQAVGIAALGESPSVRAPAAADAPVRVAVGAASARRLPAMGLGCASDGRPLTNREAGRVAGLRPAHLRLELSARDPDWDRRVMVAVQDVRAIGEAGPGRGDRIGLDVELGLGAGIDLDLERAIEALRPAAALLDVVLVRAPSDEPFDSGPPARVVLVARDRLRAAFPRLAVGVATTFLAPLHRSALTAEQMGVAGFSVSPEVHRSDDATVLENVARLRDEVEAAQAHVGSGPVRVGPVTLATTGGPYPGGPRAAGDPPPQVDRRQPSLLAAAWTVAAAAELAAASPAAVTWFETAGWRGVTERDAGSPRPDRFLSRPSAVFPVWHVLADLGEWRAGAPLEVAVGDPERCAAVAVREASSGHVLLANLTREVVAVELHGLGGGPLHVRRLGVASAETAMSDPMAFRARFEPMERSADGPMGLRLGAYEVVRLDHGGEQPWAIGSPD